jgi:DNA replication protein DnaC
MKKETCKNFTTTIENVLPKQQVALLERLLDEFQKGLKHDDQLASGSPTSGHAERKP